jgi:hypothetical protein
MFELLTVTINNKKQEMPIRFGMNSLRLFTKATNRSLNDLETLGQGISLDDALQLIHAGLIDGHRKSGQMYNYTIEDLADLMDEDQTIIERAMAIFSNHYNTEPLGNDKGVKKTPLKKK